MPTGDRECALGTVGDSGWAAVAGCGERLRKSLSLAGLMIARGSGRARVRAFVTVALALTAVVVAGPTAVAHADAPISPLVPSGRWFTDAQGRVVVMHGINMMDKSPPYLPAAQGFGKADVQFLAEEGFDALRLGVDYSGIEPAPGQISAAYLAAVRSMVELLGRYGIRVLLSSDNNCYNARFGGQGMPDWMVNTDGLPPSTGTTGFPNCYTLNDPAMDRAWDNFYANDPAPDGKGLQTHYDAGWAALAAALKGQPNVLGYDTLNEPWAGSQGLTCANPLGCPTFEAGPLTAYTARMASAIHAADPTAIVFGEPELFFDFGVKTALGPFGSSGPSAFSFHLYCLPESEYALNTEAEPECPTTDNTTLGYAINEGHAIGAPPFLSEFGATDHLTVLERVTDEADAYMLGWTEWTFYGADPCCARPDEGLVYNISKPPDAANVKQAKLAVLVRPYPQLIAGTPLGWGFDRSTKVFTLRYSTTPVRRAIDSKAPTEVFIPQLQYPTGYCAAVSGARVTSPPTAGTLELSTDPGAASVSLTVTPGRGSHTDLPTATPQGAAAPSCRRPASRPSCGAPTGRLAGNRLGPVELGQTRARIRKAFRGFTTRGRRDMDFFCLAGGPGVRVGYPSPALLRALSAYERRRVRGRAVLVLTSNRYYALGNVRPGELLATAKRALQLGSGLRVGVNTWYLAPGNVSRDVLKVRHGRIEEIGIADERLTQDHMAALRFLKSFG
jgi:endoglycosylceramidase